MNKKPRKEHGLASSPFGVALRQEQGNNIFRLRQKKNVSCAELAEATGVSVPQIYNIEAGSCSGSEPVLAKMAAILQPERLPLFVGEKFAKRWKLSGE